MDSFHLPLGQISSAISEFLNGPYGPIVLWACFIIALLNCFFGYTLRKVWGTLLGILIGGAIGAGGAIYFQQSLQIMMIAAAIGAFFGGTAAFALYRVGLFLLCAGLTFFGLYFFFPSNSNQTIVFYGIAAVFVGILSNIYEHIVIILSTSLGGGMGAIYVFYLINGGKISLVWIAGILISILGFLFQLKPWKKKGYWNERRNRDKISDEEYRSRRRQKRKNRSSIPSRISSLFARKKKTKKKQRTIYDDTIEDIYTDLEPNDSAHDSIPTEKTDPLEFDYSSLDPFDYAMEDKYSVNVDRSVFDKTQPDLSSSLSENQEATKKFSIHSGIHSGDKTKTIRMDKNDSDTSLHKSLPPV